MRSRPLLLGVVVWILLGSAALALVWGLTSKQRAHASGLEAHGVTTIGQVLDPEPQNHDTVSYSYVVNGETYQGDGFAEGPEGDATKLHVGEPIHVVYDARSPGVSCYCNVSSLASNWWANDLPVALVISTLLSVVVTRRLTSPWNLGSRAPASPLIRRIWQRGNGTPDDHGQLSGSGRRRVRPGAVWTGIAVGLVLFGVFALVESLRGSNHIPGWAWIEGPVGFPVLVLVFMYLNGMLFEREPLAPPRLGIATGRMASPPSNQPWLATPTPEGAWRWKGGVNAPHLLGWFHSPIAWLEIAPQRLLLKPFLGRLFLVRRLELTASDNSQCFPVTTRFGRPGIAIYPAGGRPWYFWTPVGAQVLATLATAGFTVSWEERRAKFW